MRNSTGNILLYILIFVLQVIIGSHLNLGVWFCVTLLPFILIGIPSAWDIRIKMLLAFTIGLLLDICSGGVMGVNASAAVITVAVKDLVYRKFISTDGMNPSRTPSSSSVGLGSYIEYLLIVYAVFIFVFVVMDCFSLRPFGFILLKSALSLVLNVALALLLNIFLMDRD